MSDPLTLWDWLVALGVGVVVASLLVWASWVDGKDRRRAIGKRPPRHVDTPPLPDGYRFHLVRNDSDLLVAHLEERVMGSDSQGNLYEEWETIYAVSVSDSGSPSPGTIASAFRTLSYWLDRRRALNQWSGVYRPGDPIVR